jgi:hypothetical protein
VKCHREIGRKVVFVSDAGSALLQAHVILTKLDERLDQHCIDVAGVREVQR